MQEKLAQAGAKELGLTSLQHQLLLVLAWDADDKDNLVTYKAEQLAEKLAQSERGLRASLKTLEEKGYITISRGNGRNYPSMCWVHIDRNVNNLEKGAKSATLYDDKGCKKCYPLDEKRVQNHTLKGAKSDTLYGEINGVQINNLSLSCAREERERELSTKNGIVNNSENSEIGKEGTWNGERGTGNGEEKTGQGERGAASARGSREACARVAATGGAPAQKCAATERGGEAEKRELTLAEALKLARTNGWRPETDRERQEQCDAERKAMIRVAHSQGLPIYEAVAWVDSNGKWGWNHVTGGNSVMSLLREWIRRFKRDDPQGWLNEQERRREEQGTDEGTWRTELWKAERRGG